MPELSVDRLPNAAPPAPASPVRAVSLAFWLCLFTAGLLYAAGALAPRLSEWTAVRHDYIRRAHRLQALEEEIDYLERVRKALRTDPEFVRRLTRAAADRGSDDPDLIPVSGTLVFGSERELLKRLPEIDPPFGAAVIRRLAVDSSLRTGLLAGTAALVLFAFTVLNGDGGWFVRTVVHLAVVCVRLPIRRYFRVPETEAGRNLSQRTAETGRAARGKTDAGSGHLQVVDKEIID